MAFVTIRQAATTHQLRCASQDAEEQEEEERMRMVRQLQKSFYSSTTAESTTLLDSKGRILNLCLWRVGWVEVPGRSNCLHVHEGHYTNMFEKIINNGDPMYFGHLYLPGGTKASRSGEERFALRDWQQEVQDIDRFDNDERSAVLGCLMRITDYRRLKDGRLILLVQALDRFVVDTVVQTFPHGIAHVQMLPDLPLDEKYGDPQRVRRVEQSFGYYDYECAKLPLPLPVETEYMAAQDVFGAAIAKVLPFCYFAEDDSMLSGASADTVVPDDDDDDDDDDGATDESDDNLNAADQSSGEPLLEDCLQADLILRHAPPVPGIAPRSNNTDAAALETLVWLALEDLCRHTSFQPPEEILCLRPPDMDYLDMPFVEAVSDKYPAARRQWRLSYALPALIEPTTPTLRPLLLQCPTTASRLSAVLDRLQQVNDALLGQFE